MFESEEIFCMNILKGALNRSKILIPQFRNRERFVWRDYKRLRVKSKYSFDILIEPGSSFRAVLSL